MKRDPGIMSRLLKNLHREMGQHHCTENVQTSLAIVLIMKENSKHVFEYTLCITLQFIQILCPFKLFEIGILTSMSWIFIYRENYIRQTEINNQLLTIVCQMYLIFATFALS